jgi:hypothetical protein
VKREVIGDGEEREDRQFQWEEGRAVQKGRGEGEGEVKDEGEGEKEVR